MSEQNHDAGSTQMFRAFVENAEPERSGLRASHLALIGAVVLALVVVGALAWVSLGG
ncbi:MAG: hypothetical protein ACRDYU_19865 [Actinomycetes bacterium]